MAEVEDLPSIEDRIMTMAEPRFREGGVLAKMHADRPSNKAVYDFVESVKDVAQLIQEEQRMKADPAYKERLRGEARRNTEAIKRQG